mmetsp:Transcript_55512/g.114616  ORF Transcript_55512/g.114616 Transcript_55512/m.114616 type:complete len:273 (+) Transcript_55512:195-1013(+)
MLSSAMLTCSALHRNRCQRLIRNSSQSLERVIYNLQACIGCRRGRHSHLHRRLQAGCRSGRRGGPIIFPIIFPEAPAASGDQEGVVLETPGIATVSGVDGIDICELCGLLKGLLVQSMPWAVVACAEAVEAEMVVPGDEPPRHDLHLLHSFGAGILEEDAAQVAAICGGLQVDDARLSLHNALVAPLVLVLRHVRGLARTCDALHQNASAQGLIQTLLDPLVLLQIVPTGALQNAYFRLRQKLVHHPDGGQAICRDPHAKSADAAESPEPSR